MRTILPAQSQNLVLVDQYKELYAFPLVSLPQKCPSQSKKLQIFAPILACNKINVFLCETFQFGTTSDLMKADLSNSMSVHSQTITSNYAQDKRKKQICRKALTQCSKLFLSLYSAVRVCKASLADSVKISGSSLMACYDGSSFLREKSNHIIGL